MENSIPNDKEKQEFNSEFLEVIQIHTKQSLQWRETEAIATKATLPRPSYKKRQNNIL